MKKNIREFFLEIDLRSNVIFFFSVFYLIYFSFYKMLAYVLELGYIAATAWILFILLLAALLSLKLIYFVAANLWNAGASLVTDIILFAHKQYTERRISAGPYNVASSTP